jgi:hypothetical protein
MMRLDAVREMIMAARRSETVAPPFPSGVATGDNRAAFLNASEAGRCTRWLWYSKSDYIRGRKERGDCDANDTHDRPSDSEKRLAGRAP